MIKINITTQRCDGYLKLIYAMQNNNKDIYTYLNMSNILYMQVIHNTGCQILPGHSSETQIFFFLNLSCLTYII